MICDKIVIKESLMIMTKPVDISRALIKEILADFIIYLLSTVKNKQTKIQATQSAIF
jgi:hypothetical protein